MRACNFCLCFVSLSIFRARKLGVSYNYIKPNLGLEKYHEDLDLIIVNILRLFTPNPPHPLGKGSGKDSFPPAWCTMNNHDHRISRISKKRKNSREISLFFYVVWKFGASCILFKKKRKKLISYFLDECDFLYNKTDLNLDTIADVYFWVSWYFPCHDARPCDMSNRSTSTSASLFDILFILFVSVCLLMKSK